MQTVEIAGKKITVLTALRMIADGETLFDHAYVDIAEAAIKEIEYLRSLAGAVSRGPDLSDIKQGVGRSNQT